MNYGALLIWLVVYDPGSATIPTGGQYVYETFGFDSYQACSEAKVAMQKGQILTRSKDGHHLFVCLLLKGMQP